MYHRKMNTLLLHRIMKCVSFYHSISHSSKSTRNICQLPCTKYHAVENGLLVEHFNYNLDDLCISNHFN
jgi:hypothetical protein